MRVTGRFLAIASTLMIGIQAWEDLELLRIVNNFALPSTPGFLQLKLISAYRA